MNQPYTRVNQPYATLTLASALHEMFVVQLHKNNARVLLLRTLSILLDWLQNAHSVCGVYEYMIKIGPIAEYSSQENTAARLDSSLVFTDPRVRGSVRAVL